MNSCAGPGPWTPSSPATSPTRTDDWPRPPPSTGCSYAVASRKGRSPPPRRRSTARSFDSSTTRTYPAEPPHAASVPRLLSGSAHSLPGTLQLTASLRQPTLREGVAGAPVPQVLGKTHHDRVLHLGGRRAHVVVVDHTEDQPTPVRCGHMAGQGTDPGHRAGLGLHDTLGRGTDHATRERAPDERVRVTRHRQGHPKLLRPRGVTCLHQQIGDGARVDPVAPG